MLTYFGLHSLPAGWKTLNTDFSNYYLTARLAREKTVTSRVYEWIWLQRQKDHRDIDQRIISFVPITPFSTPRGLAARRRASAAGQTSLAGSKPGYGCGYGRLVAVVNSASFETHRTGDSTERSA